VVVMGDKVIGSFKRYNANSFKNNISTGWKEEPYKISHDLEKKSIDICKKYWLGVAWLDFFIAQEWPIFIEINKRPEYRWFESATGIDFVYELLSYFKTL
jgi:glutathione synthase/RimK-type ligase-like ATP-grasp enzyme